MYKRLTREQHEGIVKAYLDCLPIKQICLQFEISWDTVYETIKMLGVGPRRITIRKLSAVQRKEIINLYRSGITTHQLARNYGVSVPSICYILKLNKTPMRPSAFAKTRDVNESAFNKISEQSAYWIGFLVADSHLRKAHSGGQSVLELHIARRDVKHLRQFRRFLQATHKIEIYSKSCKLSIRSNKIIDALAKCGLKFNGIREPNGELTRNRHFWRGFIDGDGCVTICKMGRSSSVPVISAVGTELLMRVLLNFAGRPDLNPSRIKRCIKPTYQVSFTFRAARKLIRILYADNSISLRRKQLIADKIMREFPLD